jgi:NHS family xanthosine MFS transporter
MAMLKFRLTVMNFLQYYIWGAWLLTMGTWWFHTQHWSSAAFGWTFATMGIASLFMPSIAGIIADKWIRAERLYGCLQILGAVMLYIVPHVPNQRLMFWVMLVNMIFYMPTISLSIAVAYNALKREDFDVVKTYPPIRVWGTIGFIIATWTVSFLGFEASDSQFYVAAGASLLLGFYAFTLPRCEPGMRKGSQRSLTERLGLNAFGLFKNRNMAVFFIFAMLLGAALQLTNAYGDTFLKGFEKLPQYAHLFTVTHSAIIISISQISEVCFILTIPFFLKRFGIKTVMVMSMLAWVVRFGLFGFGNPAPGDRLWMIIVSDLVYGMAFDFFNISGSLFVEEKTPKHIRASAQGLFMLMTNGVGAVLGNVVAGQFIVPFFTNPNCNQLVNICKDWRGIWLTFAGYALLMAIFFIPLFKYRHTRKSDIAAK